MSTGKKINELDSISTVTDQTVFPAVLVQGSTISSSATKVSIEQLKNNLQNSFYTEAETDILLNKKQDKLTAGENITIEEDSDENLVISSTSVMTGATASAAGISGLVPAPSAGDQAKYLTGAGTWETPSGLQNTATGNDSLTVGGVATSYSNSTNIGVGSKADNYYATAIGKGSNAKSDSSTAIGYNAEAQGNYSIAINGKTNGNYALAVGSNARALANGAVQLLEGGNTTANTIQIKDAQFYNLSTGKVVMARLPIEALTQAEYDAKVSGGTIDANTLYLITPAS